MSMIFPAVCWSPGTHLRCLEAGQSPHDPPDPTTPPFHHQDLGPCGTMWGPVGPSDGAMLVNKKPMNTTVMAMY